MMSTADEYRKKVAEFEDRARGEKSPTSRVEWIKMATSYRKLAELADRNAKTDVVPIAVVIQRQRYQAQVQKQQQPAATWNAKLLRCPTAKCRCGRSSCRLCSA